MMAVVIDVADAGVRRQGAAYIRGVQHSDYPEQPVDGVVTHEIGNRTYVVADVDPLDLDGTWTVAVGTGLFLLAFLVLLPFHERLEEAGKGWWQWTCQIGRAHV